MNIRINKVAVGIIGVAVLLALCAGVTVLVTSHINAHNLAVQRAHSLVIHKRAEAKAQAAAIAAANAKAAKAVTAAKQAQRAARKAASRPVPAPAPVVVQPAAPAVVQPASSGLTDCGTGTQNEDVYANADTSCPLALNVEADFWNAPGYTFTSYSPVTGQSYFMSATDNGVTVTVTGGTDILVEFGHGDLGR